MTFGPENLKNEFLNTGQARIGSVTLILLQFAYKEAGWTVN